MPRLVDQVQQKEDIARATWSVITDVGLERASLRQIAGRTGCTTGLLTHLFDGREDLIAYALEAQDRAMFDHFELEIARADDGRGAVTAMLCGLCMASEGGDYDGVLFRRLAAALGDAAIGQGLSDLFDRVEARLTALLDAARDDGSLVSARASGDLAEHLMLFTDGIYVASVARPERYPDTYRRTLIERELDQLEDIEP